MLTRLRERVARLVAEALPVRLAYYVGLRILAHAAVTKYRHEPATEIKALQALDHWHESMLPKRVRQATARVRGLEANGAPLWSGSIQDGTLRQRDVAAGEVLETVEVEAVHVRADVKARP